MYRFRILFFLLLMVQFADAQLTYQQVWVDYDSAWTYKNLQLVPIRFRGEGKGQMAFYREMLPDKFISLSEGMKSGKIKVKEFVTKGDADVHILSVRNNSGMHHPRALVSQP